MVIRIEPALPRTARVVRHQPAATVAVFDPAHLLREHRFLAPRQVVATHHPDHRLLAVALTQELPERVRVVQVHQRLHLFPPTHQHPGHHVAPVQEHPHPHPQIHAAIDHVVQMRKELLVRPGDIVIVKRMLAVLIRPEAGVQHHHLDHVEALRRAIFQIIICLRPVQLVQQPPGRIAQVEKRRAVFLKQVPPVLADLQKPQCHSRLSSVGPQLRTLSTVAGRSASLVPRRSCPLCGCPISTRLTAKCAAIFLRYARVSPA